MSLADLQRVQAENIFLRGLLVQNNIVIPPMPTTTATPAPAAQQPSMLTPPQPSTFAAITGALGQGLQPFGPLAAQAALAASAAQKGQRGQAALQGALGGFAVPPAATPQPRFQ